MYVATIPNRSSPPAILVREGYREDGKVKNRTLANLSKLPPEAIEAVRHSEAPVGEPRPADVSLHCGRAPRELGYVPRPLDQALAESRTGPEDADGLGG